MNKLVCIYVISLIEIISSMECIPYYLSLPLFQTIFDSKICARLYLYTLDALYMKRSSQMKASVPGKKELIGYLASCKSRLNLYNTPPGTPAAETEGDEFNEISPETAFGSWSVYSRPDPNSERCVISLGAGIEM